MRLGSVGSCHSEMLAPRQLEDSFHVPSDLDAFGDMSPKWRRTFSDGMCCRPAMILPGSGYEIAVSSRLLDYNVEGF